MGAHKTKAITLAAVAAIGLTLAGGAPARAQGVTTAMSAVQQCLAPSAPSPSSTARCARRGAATIAFAAKPRRWPRQVEEARPRVNTDNRSDIEAFSALLARRDDAADAHRHEAERYAAAVARYNEAVEQDNAACSGRLFDPEEVESVKAHLYCPRP